MKSLPPSNNNLSISQSREPVLQNSPKRKGGILQSFSSCTHRFLPLWSWNFQDQSQQYHLKKIRMSHQCLKLFPILPLNMSRKSIMRLPSHFTYLYPSLNAQQHLKNQIPQKTAPKIYTQVNQRNRNRMMISLYFLTAQLIQMKQSSLSAQTGITRQSSHQKPCR